ncbi:hypothetical protein TNCV_19971 [Trichonephila clavipes]|nr:hypothetical protein TNCV_19971 [Trichonephila clavipes]
MQVSRSNENMGRRDWNVHWMSNDGRRQRNRRDAEDQMIGGMVLRGTKDSKAEIAKRLQHVLTQEQTRTRYSRSGLLSHPNPFVYNYFIVHDTNRDSSE